MSKTTEKTAEETYRERARDVHALLDFLGQEIRMHEDYSEKDGIDWSACGSMGHWRERLLETLISVMGAYDETEARKMIEDALDDAKA
jgi:hypothetical protein